MVGQPLKIPPGITRLQEQENKRFKYYKGLDYDARSSRKNKGWNGMVAPFVEAEDVVAFQLLYSLARKKPWRSFGGYTLINLVISDEVMVWAREDEAIVCFVGQNIAKNSNHLIDDLNVAGIAGNQACQLRLARIGNEIIKVLLRSLRN